MGYGFSYRLTDISFTVGAGTVTTACYVILYVAFIITVIKEFKIIHGYPRYGDLLPGPFVSDRYTWGWYFLVFNLARALIFTFYQYTLFGLKYKGKRRWFTNLIGLALLFDVAQWIFFLVVSCFFCNDAYVTSETSLCNDELYKWCGHFGDSYPDRCPPTLPPSERYTLSPNVIYLRWTYFHIGFSALDLLLSFWNYDLDDYVGDDDD